MTGWKKACRLALMGVCGTVAIGLVAVAAAGDLDTADRIASVVGAVVALLGLAWTVYVWRPPAGPPAPAVTADGGSIAAGGNVRRSTSRSAQPPAAPPAAPPGTGGITATNGSIAAGGDIEDSTTHVGP
ncbi:hypothetical protein ACFZBU_47755 [Embleya sp. NPDC008237]|uniref:hypothetical protein n=1 Tax=Embleya sp. NPDC008237 TaxID=3363978 RepID=UPI0036F17DC4